MKFGVVCDVDSKIFLGGGSTLEQGRKTFILYAHHETGFLNQVRVISEVGDPTQYFLYKVPPQERKFGENFNYEVSLKDEMIGDLQLIESILALMGNPNLLALMG